MSQVSWCDIGQHPFPTGQQGSTQIAVNQKVKNQWGGVQDHNVMQDVCRACAKEMGIKKITDLVDDTDEQLDQEAEAIRNGTFASRFRRTKAITARSSTVHDPEEARAKGYDPDYVAWLEKQALDASEQIG